MTQTKTINDRMVVFLKDIQKSSHKPTKELTNLCLNDMEYFDAMMGIVVTMAVQLPEFKLYVLSRLIPPAVIDYTFIESIDKNKVN